MRTVATSVIGMIRASMLVCLFACATAHAQNIAIRGDTVYTMAGPPIHDGVVVIESGKITSVGAGAHIPQGVRILRAKVVTPGLIDAHSVVGLSGYLNQPGDQDQLDPTDPMQPELRAIDSYNPDERLIEWVRGFGITTLHTGHAPGALISGQTAILKTTGNTMDDAVVVREAMIATTLGDSARAGGGGGKGGDKKSPGTRSKAIAMLRAQLIKTQEYLRKQDSKDEKKRPDRDLRLEVLASVIKGERPLMITVSRAYDIAGALRIAEEFKIKIVLDGAAEAYLLIDQIKAAKVPVIIHPTMSRAAMGEQENLSLETAAKLHKAGIPVALQSGFESYVPKTRVVLFEAAIAAANGLTLEEALATITIDAAKILGVEKRIGSLEAGKDGDVALYDGDPFEYLTHCTGVVISGKVVSEESR